MKRSILMGDLQIDLDNKKQNLSGLGKSSFANFFIKRDSSDPSKALDSLGKKSGQKKKLKLDEY